MTTNDRTSRQSRIHRPAHSQDLFLDQKRTNCTEATVRNHQGIRRGELSTAQLERQAATALAETPAVLVLDDVEFLLQNDGDDLLYVLSRLDGAHQFTIVTAAVDLTAGLDDRTYSSYQPRHLSLAPYPDERSAWIVGHDCRSGADPFDGPSSLTE